MPAVFCLRAAAISKSCHSNPKVLFHPSDLFNFYMSLAQATPFMCLLVQRQQAHHCASASVQLEPAFEHCKTVFCFDLSLWILFLKLVSVQVPAIH